MKIVDCRGMVCPMPVIAVKRALEEDGALKVLLDNYTARENVTKFARNRGFEVEAKQYGDTLALLVTNGGDGETVKEATRTTGKTVVLIASDRLGDGPEELGRLLMKNFLITLLDLPVQPERIFFLNTGVLLACPGSEVLEALENLGNLGVEVMSCGVCLDYFHCREKLAAGTVTNMFTIAESLLAADTVVRV
jgi:selenium metabolism protein YedF